MTDLQAMTRDEHYQAIEAAAAEAKRYGWGQPAKAAAAAATAQLHATLLVELALRGRE